MHSRLFISNNNNYTICDNVKECLHVHSRLFISNLFFFMYRWVYECIVCICAYVWVYVCIYIYMFISVYI